MKTVLQVLMSGLMILGPATASAAETAISSGTKIAKSDQMGKSSKRKSKSSKIDQQFFSEGGPDDTPLSRKEIEEMREALGEK